MGMNRRGFLKGLGAVLVAGPAVALAKPTPKPKIYAFDSVYAGKPQYVGKIPERVTFSSMSGKELREWQDEVRREIGRWRRDPYHIPIIQHAGEVRF